MSHPQLNRSTAWRGAVAHAVFWVIAIAITMVSGHAQVATRGGDDPAAVEEIAHGSVVRMPEQSAGTLVGFGGKVAASGDTLVVGAEDSSGGGAVYVYAPSGEGWVQTDKLIAADQTVGDRFGISIVLDGDTLAVGAPGAHIGENLEQGAVYLFTRADGTWTQSAKLTGSDGKPGNYFGWSMALNDDTLVIGAIGGSLGVAQPGAVSVFERGDDDDTWTEAAKLTAADPHAGDGFGYSLALDGDTLAVGGSCLILMVCDAARGWAELFRRSGDTWTEVQMLLPSDSAPADSFGVSVAVSDDTVVVGAPGVNVGENPRQGAVYVFVPMGDTWTQAAKVIASDGDAGDNLGSSVVLAGDTLVARAMDAAYVYTGAGEHWTARAKLAGAEPSSISGSLSLAGELLVVGALGSGTVDIYTGSGDTWVETATLTLPFQQHFAEAATGVFQTEVALFNPSDTNVANVLVTLNPQEGEGAVEVPVTLEPLQRRTLDVNAAMGEYVGGVSIHVESDQFVAAARQMRWGAPETYGSTLETGATDTAGTWYFAEGSTYFTNLFYLITNPNNTDANVTIRYLVNTGDPITQEVVVPAQSRQTIWVNTVPGLESTEMATVISADRAIVAERSTYIGPQFDAGTTSRGASALSDWWWFTEGETSFFDTYLLLGNPGNETADAKVTYWLPDGTQVLKEYEVPAASRRTILVDEEDPQLANTAVSMSVSASWAIVAERTMWWGPTSSSWYEGHTSLGETGEGGDRWAIAEGALGGPAAEDTYVLVKAWDPEFTGPVRLTLVGDDGTTAEKEFSMPPVGRLTLSMPEHFPELEGRRFSIIVEGTGEGSFPPSYTVEYARYQSTGGRFGNAGGVAPAVRVH